MSWAAAVSVGPICISQAAAHNMKTKTEPWPLGFIVFLGTRYRHKLKPMEGTLRAVDCDDNHIRLLDVDGNWIHHVTAQELQRDWEEGRL